MPASNLSRRLGDGLRPLGAKVYRRLPTGARRAVGERLVRWRVSTPPLRDEDHPERLAVLEHVAGDRVLEIGCGPRKTDERFIGVDLTPGGVDGSVGNADGRASQAEICADGQCLPIRDGAFDCVVARHNLEHYVNTIAVLREWERVLGPGGRGVFVVPDEASFPGRTVELDPTHFHSFDGPYLTQLLEILGWTVIVCEPCVQDWSLLVVAELSMDRSD